MDKSRTPIIPSQKLKNSDSSRAIGKLLIAVKEIKDNNEIANTLNDYFADIEKIVSDNINLIE